MSDWVCVLQFNQTEQLTLGSVRFAFNNNTRRYMNMCVTQYREGKVFQNDTYIFNAEVVTGIPLGARTWIFGFFFLLRWF